MTEKKTLLFVFFALGASIYVWFFALGESFFDAYLDQAPSGQKIYLWSKMFGLMAIFSLWLQLCLALYRPPRADGAIAHRWFGLWVLAVVVVHFLLFFFAAWERSGSIPMQVLLSLAQDYYHQALSVGQLALLMLVLVLLAGWLRINSSINHLGRRLHWLSIPVLGLAMIHSLMIGSETRSLPVLLLYALMAVAVLVLLVRRARV